MKLEVHNLGKSYDEQVILENVNFEIKGGQSLALVAPSGAGKSTLLSMVGLLLTPSAGEVLLDGQVISGLPDAKASRMRLKQFGFVFQHTQLVGSLRAIENILVPADVAGISRASTTAKAESLLAQFGLEERMYHYPYQLSIGQKRRVALARALMMEPNILIADEPTNDLDTSSQASVTDALFGHVKAGGILVFATHDAALAQRANTILEL